MSHEKLVEMPDPVKIGALPNPPSYDLQRCHPSAALITLKAISLSRFGTAPFFKLSMIVRLFMP